MSKNTKEVSHPVDSKPSPSLIESSPPRPALVVAFVSGKGGVGKTMLTVAFARELSSSSRTLLIDLDFFNRGLTGLIREGRFACSIGKPSFLMDSESNEAWSILQVSDNLFHISYPDLLPLDMQRFETLDVDLLKEALAEFISRAALECKCDCVVLDCHGGPDNSSFAACMVSDYSLLISEPDRITFYGTLNFLRQLQRLSGEREVDIRLVFNKVVPAFSAFFLKSFYNRTVRELFTDQPLLAIFPFEVYLTKAFEKTPFLTSVYPNSWLAEKTRILIYDLLSTSFRARLPRRIQTIPKLVRDYIRMSLGKPWPLANINVIMITIVTVFLLAMMISIILNQFFKPDLYRLEDDIARLELLEAIKNMPDLPSVSPALNEFLSGHISDSEMNEQLSEEVKDIEAESEKAIHKTIRSQTQLDKLFFSPTPSLKIREESRASYEEFMGDRRRVESLRDRLLQGEKLKEIQHSLKDSRDRLKLMKRKRDYQHNLVVDDLPSPYTKEFARTDLDRLATYHSVFIFLETTRERFHRAQTTLASIGMLWIGIALLLLWLKELDKNFTYFSRQKKYLPMVAIFFVALVLYVASILVIHILISEPGLARSKTVLFSVIGVFPALAIVQQLYRTYRDLRYEHNSIEDCLRVSFVLCILISPYISGILTNLI